MARPIMEDLTQRIIERDEPSASLSSLPPELWQMVIGYLQKSARKEPKHLSQLSQTCRSLYQRIQPLLYETVKLPWLIHGPRLVATINQRPDLAPFIREIRHDDDTGFEDVIDFSVPFYEMIAKLPFLETLIFRKRLGATRLEGIKWTEEEAKIRYLSGRCYLNEEDIEWEVENEETEDGYFDRVISTWHEAKEKGTLGPPDDPFGWGEDLHEVLENFSNHQHNLVDTYVEESIDLRKKTLFCGGILGDHKNARLPPKLRVCHIGTDAVLDSRNYWEDVPTLNETLFTLKRRPEKIYITGARFKWISEEESPLFDSDASSMEELVFLNCAIEWSLLAMIVKFAKGLKSFTFRGPLPQYLEDADSDLFRNHYVHLETLDIDFYWGVSRRFTRLHRFMNLKKITVTPDVLLGTQRRQMVPLPASLQSLTFRYEPGKPVPLAGLYRSLTCEDLPNLREVTCEIPDNLSNPSSEEVCFQIEDWAGMFQQQNVSFSANMVSYPDTMPEYDACSCENLNFYHRLPCHREFNKENAEIFRSGVVDFPVAQYERAVEDSELTDNGGPSDADFLTDQSTDSEDD